MSKVNKLTTSFIKITNALGKVKNQDEYNMYVSMLEEKELECLKYVQRLGKYTNRQLLASSADTDESKPEKKKRGRRKQVVDDDVIMSDPITPEEPPSPSPSPAFFTIFSYGKVPYASMLVYFELLAQHIVGVVVLLRLGLPLLVAEPYPSAADRTVPLFLANLGFFFTRLFCFLFHYEYAIHLFFSY